MYTGFAPLYAGSARCRLRLIDSEPELRPFVYRLRKEQASPDSDAEPALRPYVYRLRKEQASPDSDAEPDFRPFGAQYHKIFVLSTDNIVRFLFLKNGVDSFSSRK